MTSESLAVRLRAIFAEELEEQLVQLRDALAALQRDPANAEQLRVIFRVMHTLKGAARAAGVPMVEQVSHALEGELARARDAAIPLDPAQLAMLLDAADAFAGVRERLASGEAVDATALSHLLQRTVRGAGARASTRVAQDAATSAASATPTGDTAATTARTVDTSPGAARMSVTSVHAPEAATTPAVAVRDERAPRQEQVRIGVHGADAITAAAGEILVLTTALTDHASEIRALRSRLRAEAAPQDAGFLRTVDRELAQVLRRANDDARALASISGRLDGPLRNLRQRPLRDLTETLERVARDVAREVGKQIVIETRGDDVEADRVVIEALREPLLHLIRNAVDHGIESPEARVAAGKSPEGLLRVTAELRGDRVRLTLADDGAGLDLDAITRVLERQGKSAPADRAALARSIFDDGLSTRDHATTLSGRGVGLSIVRASAERLGGTATVRSVPGHGTTFIIEVPLSIATIRALIVRAGGVLLALPSAFVERVRAVRAQLLGHVDGRDVLVGDGAPIPVVPLATLLGPPYRAAELGDRVQLVLLESGDHRLAVAVDEMVDERELVVRPLEHVGAETAASAVGVSLLGTGDVVLVLGVPSLVADASRAAGSLPSVARAQGAIAPRARILVVDDSITSRTLEQSVLAAAGYDVTVAVDGAEAWRAIERSRFSLVVSDVEMPNLDGIGLCERIRANPDTSSLPVILVTSLDEPQHRARGLEAGADAYVAKSSFDQDVLLDTVRQLIGRAGGDA